MNEVGCEDPALSPTPRPFANAATAPRRWSLAGLLQLIGTLSFGGTLLARLARWSWLAELFSHWPAHLAAGCFLGLLGCRLQRRPLAAGLFALGLAVNLAVLLPGMIRPTVPTGSGPADVRLASANLLADPENGRSLIAWLRRTQPDLFLAMELTPEAARALAPLHTDFPYRLLVAEPGNFGIGLYSRQPLEATQVLRLSRLRIASLEVRLSLRGRAVTILATHPPPPIPPRAAQARNEQLAALARRLRAQSGPAIVIGDLNTTPWSPVFRQFLTEAGLQDTLAGHGWQPTWPAALGPLGIPIDHCLLRGSWQLLARQPGPAFGSDHRPLWVSLRLTTP